MILVAVALPYGKCGSNFHDLLGPLNEDTRRDSQCVKAAAPDDGVFLDDVPKPPTTIISFSEVSSSGSKAATIEKDFQKNDTFGRIFRKFLKTF